MKIKEILKYKILKYLPDKVWIELVYFIKMHKKLNLKTPKRFSEKLQWLKLYDRNPEYCSMVDKYEAKKIVASKIGDSYVIPTLGVWDKFDDIDFDILPKKFVLKCTHDSGGVIICKDKDTFDKLKAKKTLEYSLHNNYFFQGREWPYKDVKPRIIAEQFLDALETKELVEYKIYCFNGKPEVVLVCLGQGHTEERTNDFYDIEFNHLPVRGTCKNSEIKLNKPKEYDELLNIARILSKNIIQVRVDLYLYKGIIYFGELTFFSDSGFLDWKPEEFDISLGEKLQLPIEG